MQHALAGHFRDDRFRFTQALLGRLHVFFCHRGSDFLGVALHLRAVTGVAGITLVVLPVAFDCGLMIGQ